MMKKRLLKQARATPLAIGRLKKGLKTLVVKSIKNVQIPWHKMRTGTVIFQKTTITLAFSGQIT